MNQAKIKISKYNSPAGELILGSFGERLCLCDWNLYSRRAAIDRQLCRSLNAVYEEDITAVIDKAVRLLNQYFAGEVQELDVPLIFAGTEFQRTVWAELMKVPCGETISYGELARRIGNPMGVRAVASAVGANRLSIFVPCHRVIGSDNRLTGYAGGLPAKKILLSLEGYFGR